MKKDFPESSVKKHAPQLQVCMQIQAGILARHYKLIKSMTFHFLQKVRKLSLSL